MSLREKIENQIVKLYLHREGLTKCEENEDFQDIMEWIEEFASAIASLVVESIRDELPKESRVYPEVGRTVTKDVADEYWVEGYNQALKYMKERLGGKG